MNRLPDAIARDPIDDLGQDRVRLRADHLVLAGEYERRDNDGQSIRGDVMNTPPR
ncbi:MAG: hypothetical protein ACRDGG_02505 [Anaerolineae bacterium]